MKRTVEKTVLAGFVSVLVLLGIVGVVSQRTIVDLIDDNQWVTHTHVVMELLQNLSFQVTQAEASARGYVLTGDPRFESQYLDIKKQIPPLIAELGKETSDNPREQSRIGPLQSIIGERFQVLDDALRVRKTQGLNAILERPKTGRGTYLSSLISIGVTDFRKEEERLLADRNARAGRSARRTFFVVLSSVLLAMIATLGSVFLIFRDLTRRRQLERMKSEFVSMVSHELRTPLASIHGSLALLASGLLGNPSEKGARMLEIAVNNTDRLMRLINDILDLEKFDYGKLEMNRRACDSGELIRQAGAEMRALAHKHEIELKLGDSNDMILADADRMVQCLTNLISNAIKFSNAGGVVHVDAHIAGSDLCFAVADRGRGIPSNMRESIFERFHQVDASDSRKKGGTGLGLAICRTIVQQHGGRIWVESNVGEGSTFFFTVPLATQQTGAAMSMVLMPEISGSTRETDVQAHPAD
jgi:signal transduction histidine kinase